MEIFKRGEHKNGEASRKIRTATYHTKCETEMKRFQNTIQSDDKKWDVLGLQRVWLKVITILLSVDGLVAVSDEHKKIA